MIGLVTKFIDWVKDMFSLIVGFPARVSSLIASFSSFFSFLPHNLGTILFGFIVLCITFVVVYAIVKLVASLL